MPPTEKKRWWDIPHDFLDFEFAIVPMISNENPTASVILLFNNNWYNKFWGKFFLEVMMKLSEDETTYQAKMRENTASCLLAEAFAISSLDQKQTHPPSKLAITWARARSTAAANPRLKALWLGSLHSKIHSLKCFTCWRNNSGLLLSKCCNNNFNLKLLKHALFWATSASMLSIPAVMSRAMIKRQIKNPMFFGIVAVSKDPVEAILKGEMAGEIL